MSVRPPRVLAPLILACALLLAPAHAGAAAVQFGSSLAPGPVVNYGCNVQPGLTNSPNWGDFGLFFNNEPGGCTWSQAGVWGLNSGSDPRARSVPADGRITAAEILSGPNPSPIWITIIRQLAQPGVGDACCFWRSDTGPFQLTPSAVTTLPLNIPVEHNAKEGVLGVDLVSVSAENDGGSLPLRVVGPSNVLSIPDGDPMAGVFYPRMGRIPNDEKGGRHEIQEGVPGLELLVRWTFCATGDVTCGGAPPVAPGPTVPLSPAAPAPVVPRLGSRQAQVKEGNALVGLICGGNTACEGQLSLLAPTAIGSTAAARAATAVGSGAKGKAAPVVYGTASYKLAAGAKGTVKVKLNRRGKKLLQKHARASVTLQLTPKGGTTSTTVLTLSRPTAKAH
ncbi:MAG TPA: hypothetical protein VJL81_11395 [Solirubrobacterales bacterium]|nr:hypothetical protein [Solirubrobacterales bacterium]